MKSLTLCAVPFAILCCLLSPPASAAQPRIDDAGIRTRKVGMPAGVQLPQRRVESKMPRMPMPAELAPAQPSAGLVINGVFDSSITSQPNAAAIEAAFNAAVARYQMMFTDPIMVKILFRYASTTLDGHTYGGLGFSNSVYYASPWASFMAKLSAEAKSPNDTKAIATVPGTAQTTDIEFTAANGRAMGFDTPGVACSDGSIKAGCDYDGIVTLVSGLPITWSFSRPLPPNTFDAQSTIEHEIDEVLGTGSGVNFSNFIERYQPLDLWTWSAPGTRNVTTDGTRYFSLDNGVTNIVEINQDTIADMGDFAVVPGCPETNPHVQDAGLCPDQSVDISPTTPEGILLDVMGFDAAPTLGPSSIAFSANNYDLNEGGGHGDVTVTRTGDTSGTATVDYSTFDQSAGVGHASQTSDYQMSVGTLSFAVGEASKTFRVLIVDDKLVEGNETIGLMLSSPTGTNVSLGSPNSAKITIIENDSASTTVNPYDDPRFFVRQHYLDFLNREPDQSGWDFWTNQITSCGTDASCIEVRRINVSAAFFLSIEFKGTGYEAYLTHRSAFGPNAPNSPVPVLYTTFMHDVQELGKGYVFGAPGADQALEANKEAYFNEFVVRPEFVSKYPVTLTNQQYVENLLATAGLPTTGSFHDSLIIGLDQGDETRATVLRLVAQSSVLQTREFNRAFVMVEYFGYLRRDPDTAGYNFWLTKLNSFNGDYIAAEMVKAFITSTEARQRFGNP